MDILGAVLTGGSSSRMGTDKATVEIMGSTMLEMVATAVGRVTADLVLLGSDHPGYQCWVDDLSEPGPLAGLATALRRTVHSKVLLVAVDHALARSATLAALTEIESELPVVPVDEDGVRQVTCAVYPAAIAGHAANEAGAGGSIQSLLDRVSFHPVTPDIWTSWGEDGRSWFSFDSPDAITSGLAKYGSA